MTNDNAGCVRLEAAMRRGAVFGLLLVALGSAAPTFAQERSPGDTASDGAALDVARALVDAFNRHDPAAMARWIHPEFELFYFDDSGRADLAVSGPEAFMAEMASYFEALPDVRSEMEGAIPGTRFVAFRERIVGGDSSLAIYEIVDELVRRAWYYPAERDPVPDPDSPGALP